MAELQIGTAIAASGLLNQSWIVKAAPPAPLSASAFVALGSNLGDSVGIILQAMERLQAFSDEPLLKSSLWETSPVDCPPQSPKFVNAVVGLVPRPGETPESLLAKLQALEGEFGRASGQRRNAPRTLDLDLIAFREKMQATGELTLPHPRAHLRRFVLQPLAEIAPDLILPGQERNVRKLMARLESAERLRRIRLVDASGKRNR